MTREHKTCIIIDDEPIAIRIIKEHLAAFDSLQCMDGFTNPVKAMEFLSTQRVDLIFLDIQMPQITGMDFLKSLDHPPKVIFTTAYRDYAVEAFELEVIDYLLKPISLVRFSKAINRFYQQQSEYFATLANKETTAPKHDYLFLKADKKWHKIVFDEIIYLESLGDYLTVHTQNGKITTKERISHLNEQLPSELFIRVHRSYIISRSKITALLPGQVELGELKIPIGRSYKEIVGKLLTNK